MSLIPIPLIVSGQLMQRLKLNFWGFRAESSHNVCKAVYSFWLLTISATGIMLYLQVQTTKVIYTVVGLAFLANAALLNIFWSYRLRMTLRSEQSLPITLLESNEFYDDCLISAFCNCCSLIQIARERHDNSFFTYYFCSETG